MLSSRWNQIRDTRYFKVMTLTTVAISCLAIGLVVSSSLNWARPASAQNQITPPQGAIAAPASRPDSFSGLAEKLSPSVVNIKVVKIEKAGFNRPEMEIPDRPMGDLFKRFFQEMPQAPESRRTQGAGSGVVIGKEGYILTNNHVVEGAKEVTVTFANHSEKWARTETLHESGGTSWR